MSVFDDSRFHALAQQTFHALESLLEEFDAKGLLEIDSEPGLLTVNVGGRQLIVSRHGPSRQLWLSSPLSGGLHFSYDGAAWRLADGRELFAVLRQDIASLGGPDVALLNVS